MLESSADQGFQVINFQISRNLPVQSLPRIAWAFNEFDGGGHVDSYLKSGVREFRVEPRFKTKVDVLRYSPPTRKDTTSVVSKERRFGPAFRAEVRSGKIARVFQIMLRRIGLSLRALCSADLLERIHDLRCPFRDFIFAQCALERLEACSHQDRILTGSH